MPRESNPLERTSVQLMLFVAGIALFANSAVDRTDDGLPWEVTLAGFCVFAVVFCAIYAKKTEVALSIVTMIAIVMPTYYVHNYEVPASNWELGSMFPLKTSKEEVLRGCFKAAPNASRFDKMLPFDLSLAHFSVLPPGLALRVNTSEIYHSGLKLDDPLTKERTHDYLLFSSPRKVKEKTESLVLLARVPSKFEVWPKNIEDYSFSLQTASNIVAPPTMFGEVTKLDKGPAIEHLQRKHHLRPFMLDVYRVEYVYE